MTLTLILIAVILILSMISFFLVKQLSNSKKELKKEQAKTKAIELQKVKLMKSIDDILLYQSKDKDTNKDTQAHIEILKKSRSNENVKKELGTLRDSIYYDYSKLRND